MLIPSRCSTNEEFCRICHDTSSGFHFGVFTCEACKGFFRRYSKKTFSLPACPLRCHITKLNRNNCAACRFDKCKRVGMALDHIRFGKTPKPRRSARFNGSLRPNATDVELMSKLFECYQTFEDKQIGNDSSVIIEFCHRLVSIVLSEGTDFLHRFERHRSAIEFLITGENSRLLHASSREAAAWRFAHNERWRLLMILLILAFDDDDHVRAEEEQSAPTQIDRILRLFEFECDQRRVDAQTNDKTMPMMKAQFVLRFVDLMTQDLIV